MKVNQPGLLAHVSGKSPEKQALRKTVADRNLYTINEARERLGGISRSFIYVLMTSGRLPSIKLSRRRFVSKEAIDAFVASAVGARVPVTVRPVKNSGATFATLRLPSSRSERRQ